MDIQPQFENLSPEGFENHRSQLRQAPEAQKASEILNQLLDSLEPIDFQELAFEQAKNLRQRLDELHKAPPSDERDKELKQVGDQLAKMRVTQKHYLVCTIDHLLEKARSNHWRLCKHQQKIYLYNEAYWEVQDPETFQNFLGEAALRLGIDRINAMFYEFREKLFKQFLAVSYLPKPESDPEEVLINLRNGTYEIGTKERKLRPFDSADFLTYQLPFSYDPDAKAPLFQKFLNEALPNPKLQKLLAEYLGFLFIKNGSRSLKEEKALILYGSGANGKSVVYEVINALLGPENVANHSLQDLTNEQGYHRATLANKLLNYASEINGKLEASVFKQMVSGEPISARLPYGHPFTLTEYAKLIFNCNELPKEVEQSNAFFRRFLILPFEVTIPEEKQDKELAYKIIKNELPGVFNWVLQGLDRLLAQKCFTNCPQVQETVAQFRKESDSVALFLEEAGLKANPDSYQKMRDLFQRYREFCAEDGYKACNKKNFRKRIENQGIQVEKHREGIVVYAQNSAPPF